MNCPEMMVARCEVAAPASGPFEGAKKARKGPRECSGRSCVRRGRLQNRDFAGLSRWRDPDSNRGHHDFQGVLACTSPARSAWKSSTSKTSSSPTILVVSAASAPVWDFGEGSKSQTPPSSRRPPWERYEGASSRTAAPDQEVAVRGLSRALRNRSARGSNPLGRYLTQKIMCIPWTSSQARTVCCSSLGSSSASPGDFCAPQDRLARCPRSSTRGCRAHDVISPDRSESIDRVLATGSCAPSMVAPALRASGSRMRK
jgi:hypothetical protein